MLIGTTLDDGRWVNLTKTITPDPAYLPPPPPRTLHTNDGEWYIGSARQGPRGLKDDRVSRPSTVPPEATSCTAASSAWSKTSSSCDHARGRPSNGIGSGSVPESPSSSGRRRRAHEIESRISRRSNYKSDFGLRKAGRGRPGRLRRHVQSATTGMPDRQGWQPVKPGYPGQGHVSYRPAGKDTGRPRQEDKHHG
jgi:hypothetical protein